MICFTSYISSHAKALQAAGTMFFLAIVLGACTPIPIYQPPKDTVDSAHLQLSFTDVSFIAGVAIISQTEGDIICGEPLPNVQKMIVISKGNPLISNLNAMGTTIPAGKKFTFVAMGLQDGARQCGRTVSFVPKAGSQYEISLVNKIQRRESAPRYTVATDCPIGVYEVLESGEGPVEFTYEQCQPRK